MEQMDEGEGERERCEEGVCVCVDRQIEGEREEGKRNRGDRKTVSMETRKEPL